MPGSIADYTKQARVINDSKYNYYASPLLQQTNKKTFNINNQVGMYLIKHFT